MSSSQTTPSKTTGQLHSIKGAVKETVGGVIKSANLTEQGRQEHQLGNAQVSEAKGNKMTGTNTSGNTHNSGPGGPFSGTNLSQYDDPNNNMRTDNYNSGGHHLGSTGEGMVEGLAATGGGAGVMGFGTGDAGMGNNQVNAAQHPGADAGMGMTDRQTKQDLKEWNRNAF